MAGYTKAHGRPREFLGQTALLTAQRFRFGYLPHWWMCAENDARASEASASDDQNFLSSYPPVKTHCRR
jgi:hypothetical protein